MNFGFGKYRLRSARKDEEALIAGWIEQDPDHAGRVRPEFFTEHDKGIDAMMLEDDWGPLFAIRIEKIARLHIQFSPAATEQDRERLRNALTEGCDWLAESLSRVGIRELIFTSRVPRLIAFCRRRLGFEPSPQELRRRTPRQPARMPHPAAETAQIRADAPLDDPKYLRIVPEANMRERQEPA